MGHAETSGYQVMKTRVAPVAQGAVLQHCFCESAYRIPERRESPRRERSPRRQSPRRSPRSPRREDRERREEGRDARSPRRDDRREEEGENKGNTLFVTGLSTRTRDSDLEARFSKYGKVVGCKLITDPRTSESRGFAFVSLDTAAQADDSIYYLDKTEMDGRVITVEKARRGRERSPTPGKYLGRVRDSRGPPRGGGYGYPSRGYSSYGYERDSRPSDRDYYRGPPPPSYAPYRGGPDRRRGYRDESPYYNRGGRPPSPYYDRRSPYYDR